MKELEWDTSSNFLELRLEDFEVPVRKLGKYSISMTSVLALALSFIPLRVISTIFLVELLLQVPCAQAQASSLCAALVRPYQYPCEEITVRTADGFLLGVQNIPYGIAGPGNGSRGPPVLLIHGLLLSGDNFVVNGPQQSLAFILADAGYDVYVGNNRNVQFSRGSVNKTFEESWDWTWDELAAFDVPAMVDYIYSRRRRSKVFYVGHSQGTLTVFTGLSGGGPAAEQMKNKLRGAVFLAPVAYLDNLSIPFLQLAVAVYADQVLPLLGVGPLDVRLLYQVVCNISSQVCSDGVEPALLGTNNYVDDGPDPPYLRYFVQPTSSYNINHFAQLRRSGDLRKYDRGVLENLQKYGQAQPPLYNLMRFPSASFPQLLYSGGIDQLADPRDVARLLRELPNAGNRQVVALPDYGHVDFLVGYRAYLDVYPGILYFFQSN